MTAPFSGTVRQVLVMANAQVGAGDAARSRRRRLGTATPTRRASRARSRGSSLLKERRDRRVSRTRAILRGVKAGIGELARGPGAPALLRCSQNLRRLMLGFDVDPAESKRLVSEYVRASQAIDEIDPEQRRAEDDLLQIFVDISAVFGRHAAPGGGGGRRHAERGGVSLHLPPDARGEGAGTCPAGSSRSSSGRWRTTASTRSSRRPPCARACCGCSSPVAGPTSRWTRWSPCSSSGWRGAMRPTRRGSCRFSTG